MKKEKEQMYSKTAGEEFLVSQARSTGFGSL